ncbi:MAG: O-antigen ligase family protein [Candidatus Zixiibacteriota bacterium]|nr:MAG: O-antigen ligase family protein [candidate division Zixibacteria bacterium]
MLNQRTRVLRELLFYFYALFVFGSTFSIALAQVSLGISLLLFIIVAAAERYQPFDKSLRWFYGFVGLYILWMLIACLAGKTPLRSILILKEEWLFLTVPIGIYLLSGERYRRRLLNVFTVGVGIFALYGVVQMITGVHWFKSVAPQPGSEFGYVVKGNFPSPMTYGNYFGTATAFLAGLALAGWKDFTRKKRLLLVAIIVLGLLSTLGSYNRGAFLGLLACSIILGLTLPNRKLLLGVAGVIVVAAAVFIASPGVRARLLSNLGKEINPAYEGGRAFIWNNSISIALANPVVGVGQGNFRDEYVKLLRPDIPGIRIRVHAHNDLINIAAIAGIPGMLFFAGMWVIVFRHIILGWRKTGQSPARRQMWVAALAGTVVFAVTSLTEATFADEEVRQMLMFIWAVGLWPWREEEMPDHGTGGNLGGKSS